MTFNEDNKTNVNKNKGCNLLNLSILDNVDYVQRLHFPDG